MFPISDRLSSQLGRDAREDFGAENEDHQDDKGDWPADEFFKMDCNEIDPYAEFLDENSPFSTQHGSKGEEYQNVLVMIDDIEASWNTYSFGKALTPNTAGDPTEHQAELTRKLAYVYFSRAEGLLLQNPMKDSPYESSMIAAVHEQLVPYRIQDDKLVVIQ